MSDLMHSSAPVYEQAALLVRDAGGKVVGRTKVQKLACLLELAGLGSGFEFQYRHYGPYSEDLSEALALAKFAGLINEKENLASWGGTYSVFSVTNAPSELLANEHRLKLLEVGNSADAVELELATTAAFLSHEGDRSPWETTRKRKPEKATAERLERSKILYQNLMTASNQRLPNI